MEGKKKYFALVIFLFLALMIFSFANPGEEEKEFTDGNNNQTEQVDKNENKTEDNKTNNNQVNQNNNNNQTVNKEEKDNSYEDALAAVEKAEATYKEEDVETAKELVNKVTDTTKKGELEDRLEEVQAGIEVMELIKELEYQIATSTKKEDINTAKDYRDENEVANKLENLTNETVKEKLQERLDKVSKILDDDKAPVANIKNNEAFQENVKIEVEDEAGNDFTIYLSKDDEDAKEIENGTKTTSEGIYTLTLVDKSFNEETIRFVVDGTEPVFKGLSNGKHYDELTIEVEDLSNVIITVEKDHEEVKEVENNTKLTEDGTYKITATDEAGNTTTYWVAIDNSAPTIERTNKEEAVTVDQIVTIKDKFLTEVKVEGPQNNGTYTREDFTVGERNENFEIGFNFTTEGTYTITATDKKGLTTTETFIIDRTAPVIKGFEDCKYYYNTSVKPELIEENIKSYTLNGKEYDGKEITEDGHYTLVAIDKAGHEAQVKFAIDKTAPIITGVEEGKFYTSAKPVIEDANLAYVTINKLPYIPGIEIKLYGTYQLVAVDKAGNTTTVNFTIDNIAPKILLLDRIDYISGKYLPIKPVILEQYIESIIVKKDGKVIPYEKGQQLTDDANYEITVTDKAGNTTTVNFTMDSVSPTAMVKPLSLGVVSELDLNDIEVIEDLADILNPGLLNSDILLSEEAEFILLKNNKSLNILDKEIPIYKAVEMPSNKVVTEEGEYILVAYDKAYNITAVKFVVDKSAPIIKGVENKIYNQDVTITVTEGNPYKLLGQDTTVTVTKKGKLLPSIKTYEANETFTITEDGEYTIKAKDMAGNETEEIKFIIDKSAPVINTTIKEEVLQNSEKLNVVATVEDENIESNEVKPELYVKNTETNEFELVSKEAETIDVTTAGVTYKLIYSVTDKAGNNTTKEIITTVVNITYEVRFTKNTYEGTYNGQKHNIPEDAKYFMIKDGVEKEVTEIITYTSNEDMINAGEYTITATVGNYSTTATYKINKATIEVDFTNLPEKVELGQTLDELKANIITNHFEGNVDILDYKMYRTSIGIKDTSFQETTTVDKITEGKSIMKIIRTYTIYVTVKEEYKDNYTIKGSLNIDLTDKGIDLKLVGVSKTLNS